MRKKLSVVKFSLSMPRKMHQYSKISSVYYGTEKSVELSALVAKGIINLIERKFYKVISMHPFPNGIRFIAIFFNRIIFVAILKL